MQTTPSQAQERIDALFESVEDAVIEFGFAGLRGEQAKNWHALRVTADSGIYTSEEPSACYSEAEYNRRIGHTLTLIAKYGDNYTPSAGVDNPGWFENDDGTLDLTDWVGESLDSEQIAPNWRERLQEWIDAGNFV